MSSSSIGVNQLRTQASLSVVNVLNAFCPTLTNCKLW